MDKQKQSFLSSMSPTQIFAFGIIEGILVLCTIGFFILLGMYMTDGAPARTSGGGAARVAVQQPTEPGAAAVPEIRDVDENDHARGNTKNPKVTIVEYSDIECPFCARFHDTMGQVMDNYGDDVQWVYRHFPLESIHPNAFPAAVASECAADQGKFWEFTDLAIERQQGGLTSSGLSAIAADVGLDTAAFENCLSDESKAAAVSEDATDAANAGARGTPFSVAIGPNGEVVPINGAQPYAQVESIVTQLLDS